MTPASIRYNNPGAQWPGRSSKKFGADGYATIGGGNQIAIFSDPVNGGAAQFDLLSRNYTGLPLTEAIRKWSGGNASDAYVASIAKRTGLSPDAVLSPELLADPARAIPLAKAMAAHEAGQDYPMTDEQWGSAFQRANGGGSMPVLPGFGMLAGVPGTTIANPTAGGPQMSLPAGLLAGMDMPSQPQQSAPGAPVGAGASPSTLQSWAEADKSAVAAMPKMADFQFSVPQRAPVDLSRLAQIAQSRQKLGV
jgi:hypothetical protein